MAFISEIHYQDTYNPSVPGNPSTGPASTEYVEIALNSAERTNAADYTLSLYNFDGNVISETPLNTLTPTQDPDTGLWIYRIDHLISAPDSGTSNAEAVALTNTATSEVLNFYDIVGGTSPITALNGVAQGNTSTPVPGAPANMTIQFDNEGNVTYGPATPGRAACFTAGTMIATPAGAVAVEELQTGDLVLTKDHGAQPIRWLDCRCLTARQLAAAPQLVPIRIAAGALGPRTPERDLIVSPQHRILIDSAIAGRLFGETEVLVAAKHLLELDGVTRASDRDGVSYYHFALDRHEIVYANGAEAETLYLGKEAFAAMGAAAQAELISIFPEAALGSPCTARPVANGRLRRNLLQRHQKNQRPLQMSSATEIQ